MPRIVGKVDWQHLTQPEFDRIVEPLLIRIHEDRGDDSLAEALDGRGGDGGCDVDVHVDGRLDTVYQLKFFPEGFSGGFRDTRRRQIANSFDHAMTDGPRRWILVVPRNLTAKERSWVHKLAGQRTVEIAVWGRAKLDSELAKRQDLLAWATREPLVDTLRIFREEQAGLVRASDLGERLAALQAQASGRSAYWDVGIKMDPDGTITETLYGKTSDAHLKEPITVSFAVDAAALDEGTRTALERFANYGAGSVDLPPNAVKEFTVQGPEWVAQTGQGGRVQLGPRPRMNEPVTLRTVGADGFTLRSVRAVVTGVATGIKGQSLAVTSPGGLDLEFLINSSDQNGKADVRQTLVGGNASDVLASIEFVESITTAASVQVMRGPTVLLGLRATPAQEGTSPVAPAYERQLVEDLAVISAYANLPFDVPASLTAHERREIRRLRLLLDGAVIVEPAFGELTSTLSGEMPEEVISLLDHAAAIAVKVGKLEYDVLGHHIPIRDVMVYSPRAVAQGGDALRAALANGTAAGRSLVMHGVDHDPFWAYVPSRLNGQAPVFPVPLDIPGMDEPPLPAQPAGADTA